MDLRLSASIERMSGTALAQLTAQHEALRELVSGLDADAVTPSEAPALWQAFQRIERLAAAGMTLLARRVDESRVWERAGHRHPADYLAQQAGTSRGAARASLAASTRLARLSHTRSALCRGELSGAQAEAIADAATANPDAEQSLVDAAGRSSLSELRERCARAKAAADPHPDATHRRLHAERRLRRYSGPDGAWNLVARGTPEDGAFFNTVLDPIIDQLFRAHRGDGARGSHEARAFDALIELARRARGDSESPLGGGDVSTRPADDGGEVTDGSGDPAVSTSQPAVAGGARSAGWGRARPGGRGSLAVNPSYLALLRVDLEALVRGGVEGDELCAIAGVGPVPARVARELLGDAVLKLVITRGVDVLNVTHLGRAPTAAQRVALLWQSPGCIVEGCPNRWVEIDHRIPWCQTRHTRLDELDRHCTHHHWLKTHKGWALVPGTGPRPMVPPDDPRHPDNQPAPDRGPEAAGRPGTTNTGPTTLFDNRALPDRGRDAA